MKQDTTDELQGMIFQALGSASVIFMSNPKPGTEQVMPEMELANVAADLLLDIRKYLKTVSNESINLDQFEKKLRLS